MPASGEHHPAFEEYCECIFELKEDDVAVIQARIADRLQVSRPAVSEMIRRLEAEGLITNDGAIRLTAAGQTLAQRVVRRHRLAERFLTDLLGLSWADAHHEAGKWEHVMSDAVEAAMDRVLGNPTTCPHGNPIPGSQYDAPAMVPLSGVAPGQPFTVTRIPEELEFTPGLLDFLEQASILPGHTGVITATSPDGTITIEIEGHQVGVVLLTACSPTTYDSSLATTVPVATTSTTIVSGTAADVLPAMLSEVAALAGRVAASDGDGAAADRIEAMWGSVRAEVATARPELVEDFEFVVRRCRAAADRNRPADADRAYRNLDALVQAYLG
jgi:DtxR family Mn-dependent transcriptional regulator